MPSGSTGTVDANFIATPPAPLATTEGVEAASSSYANLAGFVNPKGNHVGECRFEYGTSVGYGESVPCAPKSLGSGNADVAVSAQTGDLYPSTTYHYRLTAINGGGSSSGEDRTFATATAPPESCPNAAIRHEQGLAALLLPDCMAFEQVSPINKHDSYASAPVIGVGDGERILFKSGAALGETPGLNAVGGSLYVAARDSAGWAPPVQARAPKEYCCGSTGDASANTFAPGLTRWASFPATEYQSLRGTAQAFREGTDGSRQELSPIFQVKAGLVSNPITASAQGADADLSHVFFSVAPGGSSGTSDAPALLAGDPVPTGTARAANVYEAYRDEAGEPSLALLARDRFGTVWGGTCGEAVGGGRSSQNPEQGAVSADASTVFFSTRPTQPSSGSCATSLSGTGSTTAGGNTVTAVTTVKGTGTTANGSSEVTAVSTSSGAFLVGQTIKVTGATLSPGTTITAVAGKTLTLSNPVSAGAGSGQVLEAGAQPLAVGQALSGAGIGGAGTGSLTAGSSFVASLAGATSFAVGQAISGAGVAPGTTVTEVNVGSSTLTLSAPAQASGTGVALTGRSYITSISGQSLTLSAAATATASGVSISAPNPLRILRRSETPAGPQITSPIASECNRVSLPCDRAGGDDEFQAASLESTKVFFTTTRDLANSDLDTGSECKLSFNVGPSPGCDLYLYDYSRPQGERLIQVSAGDATDPERGKNAEVLGVTAISGDGSHAYFVARGVLTAAPSPVGKTAQAGKPNLYMWERDAAHPGGRTAFIGTLQSTCGGEGDCSGWQDSLRDNARAVPLLGVDPVDTAIGGDGHILAFSTNAPLLGEDQDGEQSDIYRYEADSASLELISAAAPGVPGNGAFPARAISAPTGNAGAAFAQSGRWVSEDGETFTFLTTEPLVPGDVNGLRNAYLWKSGKLASLPGPSTGTAAV
ncbi:MAG TPA: hypothetical protein VHR65_00275, partial [Solirubrobacterales bacterium]|nr:hypothetical protein [Solirubrobacterales bacterium]